MVDNSFFDIADDPLIRIYMNDKLRDHRTYTKALSALHMAATLEGVQEPIVGMPDLTPSYGLPVGTVLVTDPVTGVISLNALGGDINCGISLNQTNIDVGSFVDDKKQPIKEACMDLTSGVKNISSPHDVNISDFLLYGTAALHNVDIQRIDMYGSQTVTNKHLITPEMLQLAKRDLGTLGGGNHFIDLLYIDEIYDEDHAILWDLNKDHVLSMVHTGSRGLGQHMRTLCSNSEFVGDLVDRIFQPESFSSQKGRDILDYVAIATNYAYANREILRRNLQHALCSIQDENVSSQLIYDLSHNTLSLETSPEGKELLYHRKGASRSFPANHPSNTEHYQNTGHPIIIPGSLGTATYIVRGTEKLAETHYSINHGAGRKYTRGYARSKSHQPRFKENTQNVFVNLRYKDYCEESPAAYKDIEECIGTLEDNGLVTRVAKLQPFYAYLEKS